MATELDRAVVGLNLLSLLEYEELWPAGTVFWLRFARRR